MQYADDGGIGWREKSSDFLKKLGIKPLNPANKPCDNATEDKSNREYITGLQKKASELKKIGNLREADNYLDEVSRIMKDVIAIDLRLLDISDFMLMYVNPNIHTVGSYVEYGMACLQRKPVVIFCPSGLENMPIWFLGQSSHRSMFTTLDESLEYIRHIHEDKNIDTLKRWKFFNYNKILGV